MSVIPERHRSIDEGVIGAFLRSWNDAMNGADRQMLKPLIPKVLGTAAIPTIERQRSYLVLDWYCRVSTPVWLRLAGLTAEADAIEATAPIIDMPSLVAAQSALDAGCKAAYEARTATWTAAWTAIEAATGTAAWTAAEAATEAAAWTAAWTATQAARTAIEAAVGTSLRPTVEFLQASALDLVERMAALSVVESAS